MVTRPVYRRLLAVDCTWVIFATCVIVAVVLPGASSVLIRTVCALLLVFLLPGYALTSAVFSRQELGRAERVLLGLGLSLAVTVVGGLALNLTPWGLQVRSWSIFLGSFTVLASIVALVRGRRQPVVSPDHSHMSLLPLGISVRQAVMLGLAAVVLSGAVTLACLGATWQQEQAPGYTQLWILLANTSRQPHTIRLGVRNMQTFSLAYRLVVTSGGNEIAEYPSIRLQPHQTWETTAVLPAGLPTGARVDATLFRVDRPNQIYRHVELWASK